MTPSDGRKRTLLVVDDEPAILRLLVESLKDTPFEVLTATRGDEAVELFRDRNGRVDLVLLDLQMYPWNGLTVMEELRRINPEVRIAFMSGSPSEGPVEIMSNAGVVSVFPKPFPSLAELTVALNDLTAVAR